MTKQQPIKEAYQSRYNKDKLLIKWSDGKLKVHDVSAHNIQTNKN